MKNDERRARALWIESPGRAAIRQEPLRQLAGDDVEISATYGGVSRGTESLVFQGKVPPELFESMRCPHQAGELSFPVKYGYCSVGRVTAGAAPLGQRVFCLYPHQDRYVVSVRDIVPIPDAVPDRRAVLAANMETAVNGLWDAAPAIGARVAVIGAGAVGLLSASLLARIPGVELQVIDIDPRKAQACRALGLELSTPERATRDCDLVLHASGSPSGLELALDVAGFEASIVELSWFGQKPVTLGLGGRFHNARLRIQSSQVGHVATSQRARWTYRRRMELALRLLDNPAYDALVSDPVAFDALPEALPELLGQATGTVTQLIRYI
jgi:threonine dehydrogenase-like Zn-dependent dehydrogenase